MADAISQLPARRTTAASEPTATAQGSPAAPLGLSRAATSAAGSGPAPNPSELGASPTPNRQATPAASGQPAAEQAPTPTGTVNPGTSPMGSGLSVASTYAAAGSGGEPGLLAASTGQGTASLLGAGGQSGGPGISAGQAADLAALGTMGSSVGAEALSLTVHVSSLGDASAMTKELLGALGGQEAAHIEPPAVTIALLGVSTKAVDNIPHMLVDSSGARGTALYEASPASAAAEARRAAIALQASDAGRPAAAGAGGPDWPFLLADGLARASATWAESSRTGPASDPLSHAMTALFGRETTALGAKSPSSEVFHLASLANGPLNLPAAGYLEAEGGGRWAFVVSQTLQTADGGRSVQLLDVQASLEQGQEVHKTMQAERFVQALNLLVVPNGRPAMAAERRQEDALNTLGLIGCCLTSGGGTLRASKQGIRTSGTGGGRGLLENRCLTCARAQQLCQPGPAPTGEP